MGVRYIEIIGPLDAHRHAPVLSESTRERDRDQNGDTPRLLEGDRRSEQEREPGAAAGRLPRAPQAPFARLLFFCDDHRACGRTGLRQFFETVVGGVERLKNEDIAPNPVAQWQSLGVHGHCFLVKPIFARRPLTSSSLLNATFAIAPSLLSNTASVSSCTCLENFSTAVCTSGSAS